MPPVSKYGAGSFEADMGAEAVRKLLNQLDLVQLSEQLRIELDETGSKQKKKDLTNRLKIVESIRDSDNRPEWMVLDVIPVIPPDLASIGFAGQRQLCDQRFERPVSPDHQPQQSASKAWSISTLPRSSFATKSECCSSRSMHCSTTTAARGPCSGRRTVR